MRKRCNECKEHVRGVVHKEVDGVGVICNKCYTKAEELVKMITFTEDEKESFMRDFNQPTHYHQHDMDTIEFLKRGFPPNVLTGFLIGNIIKYTQRYEYKNGEEDLMKIVDYAKRLQEWHKETHTF